MSEIEEQKFEEIKRAFVGKIEEIGTLEDMINLIKVITRQKVKSFIKSRLQEDIDSGGNSITHIEDKITFKQGLISEIDDI